MKFSWDQALRVFHPDSCTKICAALNKHQELRNQLEFLLNTRVYKAAGADSNGQPEVNWWKGKLRDQRALTSILDKLSSDMHQLTKKQVPLGPEQEAYVQLANGELGKQAEQMQEAHKAIEYSQNNSTELNGYMERVKLVNKPPEEFTREEVWYIQPETKEEFEGRIARGDYSPWGHPKEQFEEDEKVSLDPH